MVWQHGVEIASWGQPGRSDQTSAWEGSCFGLPDQVARWQKVAHDPRAAGGPKGGSRPLQSPGSHWECIDVRINQRSLALLHLFREPLAQVMHDALLQPLGAQDTFRREGCDDAWIRLDGQALWRPRGRAPVLRGVAADVTLVACQSQSVILKSPP